MICRNLKGTRIRQSLLQPYVPRRNADLLEGAAAGSWSLEIVEQSRARAAVECGQMDRGGVRKEIVVGNAGGGKPGSHRSKAILLSHM